MIGIFYRFFIGVIACLLLAATSAFAGRWGPSPQTPSENRRDGQAYTKEESLQRLDPEVRRLLNILLTFRDQPGLFGNRPAMYELLEVSNFDRRYSYIDHKNYSDLLLTDGVLARLGFKARFAYYAPSMEEGVGPAAFEALIIEIGANMPCIESRAFEGYINLGLTSDRSKTTGRLPLTAFSDRHRGAYSVGIMPPDVMTPEMYVDYIDGCVRRIDITKALRIREEHKNGPSSFRVERDSENAGP